MEIRSLFFTVLIHGVTRGLEDALGSGNVTITFFWGKWERVITFRYKLVNEARLLTRSRLLYNKTEQRKNFDQERLERNNKK